MFLSHILFDKLARIKKELRIITRKFNLNIVRAVIENNLSTGRRDPIDTSYGVSWETTVSALQLKCINTKAKTKLRK